MALDDANKVLGNKEATEADVNEALSNLKNAKNSLVASSESDSNSNESSGTGSSSSSNNNGGTSGTTTGSLPKTGSAGAVAAVISGVVALLGGLGLSRKKNKNN